MYLKYYAKTQSLYTTHYTVILHSMDTCHAMLGPMIQDYVQVTWVIVTARHETASNTVRLDLRQMGYWLTETCLQAS